MKLETATVQVLPLKTANQPLNIHFPRKNPKLSPKGSICWEGVLFSLSTKQLILIYFEPFQNAVANFIQKENC